MRSSHRVAIVTIALLVAPATAFAQKDKFVEGLVALTEALSGTYGDEGARVRSALDATARALTEWDTSIRDGEQVLASKLPTASPQNALEMHTTLAAWYLERGRMSEAAREFEAAIRIAPERPALHLFQGLAHQAANEPAEAARALHRAWELDPDDPVKAYLAAEQAFKNNRAEDATKPLAVLSAAVRRIAAQQRPPGAAPFIEIALVQDEASSTPLFGPAAYQQGYASLERSSHLDAVTALRSAASTDPLVTPAPSARMTRGAAALRDGRIADAASEFAAEIAAEPKGSEAHRMLGVTSWAMGEYEKSIEYLEHATRLNPDDERVRLTLARVFAEAGQPARAEQTLVETVRRLPSSALAHWRLGRLYGSADRSQDAAAELEAAARLSALAGKAQLYREIGALYLRESNADGAVQAFSKLVRITPNDGSAHRQRGQALLLQGHQDEAFLEFVAALLAAPEDWEAFLAIGQMHLAAGRYPDAMLVLERAVALNGNSAEARYALGTALVRAGQTEAGTGQLAEFQRLQAQDVEERRRRIDVAVLKLEAGTRTREGAHEQAVTLWQEVIAAQPDVASNHAGLAASL
ncbi:MAG TPA: tetratricopeptide repeat protein, partial [Vicinamibacterales bacterium]|nr:tetratricopeptide repeat protein [Vicinamibacterales bacterium]